MTDVLSASCPGRAPAHAARGSAVPTVQGSLAASLQTECSSGREHSCNLGSYNATICHPDCGEHFLSCWQRLGSRRRG